MPPKRNAGGPRPTAKRPGAMPNSGLLAAVMLKTPGRTPPRPIKRGIVNASGAAEKNYLKNFNTILFVIQQQPQVFGPAAVILFGYQNDKNPRSLTKSADKSVGSKSAGYGSRAYFICDLAL